MKQVTTALAIAAVWLLASAPAAEAQNHYFQSYGTLFGGPGVGGSLDSTVIAAGASVSIHEDTGWGTELDFSHAADQQDGIGHADLTSAMFNIMFVHPSPGKLRPFGVGGLGWLRMQGCLDKCTEDVTVNDFGMQAGAGVLLRANDIVGLRVDARYLWAPGNHPNRPDNYGYWRIGMGLTFMWATEP